jgi:preprotein translocase subunit Sec63
MSFKENFERGGDSDKLDYDDSASYFFGLSLLLLILIPATWIMLIKPVFFGNFSITKSYKNCQCDICVKKLKERSKVYQFEWLDSSYILKAVLIIAGWMFAVYIFILIKDVRELKTFIPHEILGVETDAAVSKVKKAYRKLSREKHPDKNPDNPEAVNEFIQITKAYTVSTHISF